MSGGGRGREEDKFLTFKVSCMWVFNFSFTREFERGENNRGREEGGRREEVGGDGDINSAKCLEHYPLQR